MPFKTYDRWLLTTALLLMGFGTLMIYSSTAVLTPAKEKSISEFHYFTNHLFTMMVSFAMMYAAYRLRPETLRKLAVPLLVLSLALLLLVFVPGMGVTAGKAKRWLRLWPSTFQPSELVKLAMVIFLARFMSGQGYRADRFYCFAVPVSVMLMFQCIFLLQPDFGSTMTLGVLTLSMLYISGIRMRYLLVLLALAVPVVIKLLQEPYRLARITAFLNPWENARGSGFQLVQSFIALGSGGLTGVGLGNSRQKLSFLPEVHTDFIFSMVGEELGFITASAVVALFAFMFLRGILIADRNRNTGEMFVYYLAFGLSMMIAIQALVNFFVVTGLAPTKGLPLPFISYGGSSLLVNMTAVGILLNLSRDGQEKKPQAVDRFKEAMRKKKARRAVYGEGI
ncbi:MAG: putative lipid II flippase FtsW [Thermodesulfovibrionales bacterium]|nr:putative lipid II flippase FtsW [Thermodesulfovibrionales bacterium]